MDSQRRIVRVAEAAEYLGLSRHTLNKLRSTGGGPEFVRITKRAVGYRVEALDRWLEGRHASSTSEAVRSR